MAMHLHRSNRTEALVDALADLLRRPPADPTARECIVVQGRGMERWLSMQLATRLGVWANPDFPFPRHLIERLLGAVTGAVAPGDTAFEPAALTWAVAAALPDLLDRREFAPLRRYLAGDSGGVRALELAERIAATFDQYVVYRPAMVLGWERGAGGDWQAILWRALIARHGSRHVAARAQGFLAAVGRDGTAPLALPQRISIFGISTLPPLYVEVLTAAAAALDVHLFVLSASGEFWGEIRSQREILRALGRGGGDLEAVAARLHLMEEHPLLASLGRLGRDFQQVVEGAVDYVEDATERYLDLGSATMLTALQSDLLHLRHRHSGSREAPPLPRAPGDRSIAVHACHGPMREVEVLHDQLLALFDEDPSLQPHDVIVMSPAIDEYAPYIEAVFGHRSVGALTIPFRITDRAVRTTDHTYDAFARILDVLPGRFTATAVTDLLEIEAIRTRLGLAAEDVELARSWIGEAGVRWGIDAAHRVALDYPPIAENTWRFGLDRLLLGYALPGRNAVLYGGVLPVDDVEGAETEALGGLAEFCARLFGWRAALQAPRPLGAWRDDLAGLLADLVDVGQAADAHLRIRTALATIAARAAAVGFDRPVELASVRAALERDLVEGATPHGFLGGGVTFCALVPMRSIPFRVICLLGMNDDLFPRTGRPTGFDVMARAPQRGDRVLRDDDRYVFLEALLSARDRLLITYVGQSIRDNAPLPPSVVVSELLDSLDESFVDGTAPSRSVRDHVVLRHPLQPFSPSYFHGGTEARFFSFSARARDGAASLLAEPRPPAPLVAAPLPPRPTPPEIELETLARFFEHPIRAFAQDRLGLRLGDDAPDLDDREPMTIHGLDEWELGDRLLTRALAGDDLHDADRLVRASGALPAGPLGLLHLERLRPQVEEIARLAARLRRPPALEPIEVDVTAGGLRIRGWLRDLWTDGRVRAQFSKLGRRSEVRLWIEHLALSILAHPGSARTTWIVARDGDGTPTTCCFREVIDAGAVLGRLVRLYRLGSDQALPLYPMASRVYAERVGPDGPERALARARLVFTGAPRQPFCDLADPYVAELHRGRDPFADACRPREHGDGTQLGFTDVAVELFGPLLAHREQVA